MVQSSGTSRSPFILCRPLCANELMITTAKKSSSLPDMAAINADTKPPCPCCADRLAGVFKKTAQPAPEDLCGICAEALDADEADALIESILAAAPLKLRWGLTVPQIDALAAGAARRYKAHCDAVVASHTSGEALTWANTMYHLDKLDGEFQVLESVATFPGHVHTDKAVRDACTAADTMLSEQQIEGNSRPDLYRAVLAYSETDEGKALTGERERYVAKRLLKFRRMGLHLDEATSAQVKAINTKLSAMGIEFQKNLGEESSSFLFKASDLAGLPDDYLSERKHTQDHDTSGGGGGGEDWYKVTLKYPCVVPLMQHCKVEATRKRISAAYDSRCVPENVTLLEEMVELRHKRAVLQRYDTHAAFITEDRMSGTAEKVATFLGDLATKLAPLLESDLDELRALKAADGAADPTIHAWDRAFYCTRLEEAKYRVDQNELKKYFPLEAVTEGLLGIYQELLGLVFEREPSMEGAAAWHEEVKAF